MIDHYDWPGGREAMLRFGPDDAPVVILALPLFEEANRTRTFAVTIMRALADRGVASALPDLPGTNDSLVPTEEASLGAWRAAYAAAAGAVRAVTSVAIRSGALIDSDVKVKARWHFSPQTGATLVRELDRVRQSGDREEDEAAVVIAGNRVSRQLLDALAIAKPADRPTRIVRLVTNAQPADLKVEGAPLWRRAEPDNDLALGVTLAEDIAESVRACAG